MPDANPVQGRSPPAAPRRTGTSPQWAMMRSPSTPWGVDSGCLRRLRDSPPAEVTLRHDYQLAAAADRLEQRGHARRGTFSDKPGGLLPSSSAADQAGAEPARRPRVGSFFCRPGVPHPRSPCYPLCPSCQPAWS
ncbi:MAG: hypothetical protein ACTFAL_00230 [Candidatus Electronema sp. V4]|uniref:hypothetical protein n=1 Tax=Candidatus Electronema sp. V4 TaxID=3454756 RepID=UPI0040556ED5